MEESLNKIKRLSKEIRKNGFNYTLVLRGQRSCIYEQEVSPKIKRYEVFLIRERSSREVFGNKVPAREVFPSNENFGDWAWSCWTFEQARQKYNELESNN